MHWKNFLSLQDLTRFLRLSPEVSQALANQRQFTRVPLSLEADVLVDGTSLISGRTTDVSMNGLYLLSDHRLPVGMDCQVALLLGGRRAPVFQDPLLLSVKASGRIARVAGSGMGIEFNAILGQDSFDSLRHLLLCRTTDAEQVRQELQQAVWSQATRMVHPSSSDHPLLVTKFTLKRSEAQPQTEIELPPGLVVLLLRGQASNGTSSEDRPKLIGRK